MFFFSLNVPYRRCSGFNVFVMAFDDLRFDKDNKKGVFEGYFLWLVIGYGFGLFLTYLGLYMMNGHGQPALLYLVPCTLGVTVILGCIRGEMKSLWNCNADSSSSSEPTKV